jgi:hypothetical protein
MRYTVQQLENGSWGVFISNKLIKEFDTKEQALEFADFKNRADLKKKVNRPSMSM